MLDSKGMLETTMKKRTPVGHEFQFKTTLFEAMVGIMADNMENQ